MTANEWNATYPVGQPIRVDDGAGNMAETRTSSAAIAGLAIPDWVFITRPRGAHFFTAELRDIEPSD